MKHLDRLLIRKTCGRLLGQMTLLFFIVFFFPGIASEVHASHTVAAAYSIRGSTGAIYLIHGANGSSPAVSPSPFIDLNTLFGATTAGANLHTATSNYVPDLSAYDAVGKTALGGIALSEDEQRPFASMGRAAPCVRPAPDEPCRWQPGARKVTPLPLNVYLEE